MLQSTKPARDSRADNDEQQPWQWSEAKWRAVSGNIRPGRALRPKAWKDGAFKSEIAPITLTGKKGETTLVEEDDGPKGAKGPLVKA